MAFVVVSAEMKPRLTLDKVDGLVTEEPRSGIWGAQDSAGSPPTADLGEPFISVLHNRLLPKKL